MKDYEQLYYDLLYEYKQALKKIDDLEQQMEILTKYKDMKIRKILVEQLINFKKDKKKKNRKIWRGNVKKAMIDYIKKEKFDDIYTPSYAIKPLLKYIPKGITIWECCDFGKSEITRLLKESNDKYDKENN